MNELCNRCIVNTKDPASGWCEKCFQDLKNNNDKVFFKQLTEKDPKYCIIRNLFFSKWAFKKGELREVLAIYAVFNSFTYEKYSQYKNAVLGEGSHLESRNLAGHLLEKHMFHGTGMECNLYENGEWCGSETCPVCNICKSGFDMKRVLANTGFARFGKGLYFAFNSSKSHDYNKKSERITSDGKRICATLVCRVVAGKAAIFYEDQPKLLNPPPGYDSVLGEVGKKLNYPELVIFNQDGALPSYIVIYEHNMPLDPNRN